MADELYKQTNEHKELFKRVLEAMHHNMRTELTKDPVKDKNAKVDAELLTADLAMASKKLSRLLDEDGNISSEALRKLSPNEKQDLFNALDYNHNGFISPEEIADIRDLSRLNPHNASIHSDIQTIRSELEKAGINLGKEPEIPQADGFTSLGLAYRQGFLKNAHRGAFLGSVLEALNTGHQKSLRAMILTTMSMKRVAPMGFSIKRN